MIPQSTFMVTAAVRAGQEEPLRTLLATMTSSPGLADPENELVPFGRFERLHVARFLLADARTAGDIAVYRLPVEPWPTTLIFLGDCDGPAKDLLAEIAAVAGDGLRRIFAHCEGFDGRSDLVAWMLSRETPPAALYINWIGRTVRRIREEEALRIAVRDHIATGALKEVEGDPDAIRERLIGFVEDEVRAGRLTLTPEPPTPLGWRIRNLADLIAVPLILVIAAPFVLVASPVLIVMLRSRETRDPELAPRPDPAHVQKLGDEEDFDVTNQFSAFGDVKPGAFRKALVSVALWLLDWSCRHIYNRGNLSRVDTIHFARWVFLEDRRKVLFASNYDGSLESYMDDFINKVAWGINLVFGNGVGFPSVRWLLRGGAKRELQYKRFLRRHQLPTAVWYKAYPGLTVADLNRNTRLRHGLERRWLSEEETREWLSLL